MISQLELQVSCQLREIAVNALLKRVLLIWAALLIFVRVTRFGTQCIFKKPSICLLCFINGHLRGFPPESRFDTLFPSGVNNLTLNAFIIRLLKTISKVSRFGTPPFLRIYMTEVIFSNGIAVIGKRRTQRTKSTVFAGCHVFPYPSPALSMIHFFVQYIINGIFS